MILQYRALIDTRLLHAKRLLHVTMQLRPYHDLLRYLERSQIPPISQSLD